MADPIQTPVADARVVIQDAIDELKTVLDGLDTSLAEMADLRAAMARSGTAGLALDPPVLPENVRPIRARAV